MINKPTEQDIRYTTEMWPQRIEHYQKILDELQTKRPAFASSVETKMIQQLIVILRMSYQETQEAVAIIDELRVGTHEAAKGVYSSRSNI